MLVSELSCASLVTPFKRSDESAGLVGKPSGDSDDSSPGGEVGPPYDDPNSWTGGEPTGW